MKNIRPFLGLVLIGSILFSNCQSAEKEGLQNQNWDHYLGDPATNQYSPLNQIHTGNADQLEIAWTYHSQDADTSNRSQVQCNPLIIDGTLYGTSPKMKLFALDAQTGKEKWVFDPFDDNFGFFGAGVNRGLAYWSDESSKRIFFSAAMDLYAINAEDGTLISSFGQEGKLDLRTGLEDNGRNLFVTANTPGIIYKDLLILGSRVSESTGALPGHIRAFNVHTGEIEWVFHTIPKPEEFGYDTWPPEAYKEMGGANAWAGMSVDHERGVVYVPTGSAAFDFYGGDRKGENLFANCILALEAATGERIWHYQTVHHDLWDRDLPAPPNLVTVNINGQKRDVVAQITKSSHIFLLDRDTGEPIYEVVEVPVPASDLEGEEAWGTQPIPTKPPPFSRNRIFPEDLSERTPEANAYATALLSSSREGDPFVPPSLEGSIILPGFDGGGEWGGAAVDPEGILYINASEMPWIIQMLEHQEIQSDLLADKGRNLYNASCLLCHGEDLKGASIYTPPTLEKLNSRLNTMEVKTVISKGKGQMPAFAHLKADELDALVAFLFNSKDKIEIANQKSSSSSDWPYPYLMAGYKKFVDQDGFPAIKPPWGTLNAVDLNKGEIIWKKTLGHHPGMSLAEGPTGTESYGGPVVSDGNLLFIAATMDAKFRVFDKRDGQLLYEADLPAAGYATPSVYAIDGKQYVVIACGGGKLGTPSGDAYVAFALP